VAFYMAEDKKTDDKTTDEEILKEALEDYKLCQAAEKDNREAALDDLEFARLGKQWPDNVKSKREAEDRPCMTFNRMPTFIRQVVNDGRQNKPAIKVHPADDKADPKTAEVINGLIRNIEYTSNADIAYDTGLDMAASCGFGYWRVDVEYSHDDTFEMDIEINPIQNPFSVYGDWADVGADSSDWNRAFVVDAIEKDVFEAKYKNKEKVDWDGEQYQKMPSEWMEGEKILVAEYWRRREEMRTIYLLSDGRVVRKEWFDAPVEGIEALYPEAAELTNGVLLQQSGITIKDERETRSYKVCQYILNGVEVLETREWSGRYIPIVPVYGEMVNVEGRRILKSLIRDAKDAQRNFNYWRTTTTELIALAPKMPFVGAAGSFETDADKWARANTDTMPFVEYDMVVDPQTGVPAPPPQRQAFAGVPAGALQEALNASDDMKTIVGMFDASIGARSNETSGKAINARKVESDTGTFHFIDNQARSIHHTGRIIIDLIPSTHNRARIIRIMGEDKQPRNVSINQQLQPGQAPTDEDGIAQIYDLTAGKYDLTVSVGPGFQTRREEAAYGMTELLRAFPQGAPVIAPELAKAQDWPGADEIAKKLEALAPGANGQNPAVIQLQQQLQQLGAQAQQLQKMLEQEKTDKQLDFMRLQLEERKINNEAYGKETDRIKATAPAFDPAQIQALVMQTLQQALQSPDVLPMAGAMPPQQGMHQMPEGQMMHEGGMHPEMMGQPPPQQQIQPEPGQAPGFFTPNA
jgi:hypothetical protein